MGLFDELEQQVMGEVGGGSPHHGNAVEAAMELIQQHGGIAGLSTAFEQKGLGSMISSWISTGPNPPITPNQLSSVLGSAPMAAAAQKLGIPPQEAATALAAVLPTIVDKLTPNGQIPQGGGAGMLGSLVKGLGLG